MRTSIVALSASADLDLSGVDNSGAKAEDNRVAILSFSHVLVMLSTKSLEALCESNEGTKIRRIYVRSFDDEDVLFSPQS